MPARVIVTASRAAGIEAPLDTVWVDLTGRGGARSLGPHGLGLGFQGKMCIHPDQIAVVNRVFTPTDAEIAFAERVVAAFAKAEAEGSAAIQLDGKFIDYPIVYRAQRVLQTDRRDPRAGGHADDRTNPPGRSTASPSSICAAISPGRMAARCSPISAPTVIKIESPQGDMLRQFPSSLPAARAGSFSAPTAASARSALDLKQPEGLAVAAPHGRERRCAGREFPAVGAGAARHRLSAAAGDQSAPGLCRADRLRRRGAAQREGRLRPGAAMPDRHGGVPGRRRRQAATGARLGARLFHLGAARLWRRRRAVPARAQRRAGNI